MRVPRVLLIPLSPPLFPLSGKRVGSGAYGFVYEGTLELPGGRAEKVILKRGKQSVNGTRVSPPETQVSRCQGAREARQAAPRQLLLAPTPPGSAGPPGGPRVALTPRARPAPLRRSSCARRSPSRGASRGRRASPLSSESPARPSPSPPAPGPRPPCAPPLEPGARAPCAPPLVANPTPPTPPPPPPPPRRPRQLPRVEAPRPRDSRRFPRASPDPGSLSSAPLSHRSTPTARRALRLGDQAGDQARLPTPPPAPPAQSPRGSPLADLYDFWYEPTDDEPEWDERMELDFFKARDGGGALRPPLPRLAALRIFADGPPCRAPPRPHRSLPGSS